MISFDDYMMGRAHDYPPTGDMVLNAQDLLMRVNNLLLKFGGFREVSSGYRPPSINAATPGASKHSKHMTCEAIDLEDVHGDLDAWCMEHLKNLSECGLYLEHPDSTPSWCHLQKCAPRSGNRVFRP